MITTEMLQPYVGREQRSADVVDPERMTRLAALLGRRWNPDDRIPPLGHFLLFRPDEIQPRIGPDGHPLRDPDGMLPAIDLPRRMWAGSRIRFEQELRPGMVVTRRSRLASAVPKSGQSGSMVFCTVVHEIADETGRLLITEEQDIVYREAHAGPQIAVRPSVPPRFEPQEISSVTADPVMLFRYSALTFNAHRIHYDREYAAGDEGYQGLVVHGPLLATLLFDHLRDVSSGRRVLEFSFRGITPAFDGEQLVLGSKMENDRALLSVTHSSGLGMTAEALMQAIAEKPALGDAASIAAIR